MSKQEIIRNLEKCLELSSTYSYCVITKYKGDYTQLL